MASYGFSGFSFLLLAAIIIFFGAGTTYETTGAELHGRYSMFQDVHVMIFIGFGFLMCFLHKGGFTATSHAYLVAAFGMLWAILQRGFWHQAFTIDPSKPLAWKPIDLGLLNLINADFCVAACLISMGAMIGRVSADQLLFMTFFEVVFYSINESILLYKYQISDIGGAIIIHTFGAYFGLACSFVLSKKADHQDKSFEDNKSNHLSDTMAMVGTLFLFCFWPSFNAVVAGPTMVGVQQRAVINTVLSICASTFATYAIVVLLYDGKFRMVEIQNATLAGGVAMGAAADMHVYPFGAIVAGALAGCVSCIGYRFIQSFLDEKIGLKDTCGVHNLHGMPGIIGGLVSVFAALDASAVQYVSQAALLEVFPGRASGRSNRQAAAFQLAAMGTTLGIAIFTGACTGALLRLFPTPKAFFTDVTEYIVEGEEEEEVEEEVHSEELQQVAPAATTTEPTHA